MTYEQLINMAENEIDKSRTHSDTDYLSAHALTAIAAILLAKEIKPAAHPNMGPR